MTFESPDPSLEKIHTDNMTVFVEPASLELPSEPSSTVESSSSSEAEQVEETSSTSEQSTSSDPSSSTKRSKRSRTVAQLEVKVDRYLDDALVEGPVDFTAPPGRAIDPITEDEIEKRMREALPPVKCKCESSFLLISLFSFADDILL